MERKEITLDFETYYDKKLKYFLKNKNSGLTIEQYIRNPNFEVIGLSVKVGNRPAEWLCPHEIEDWLKHVEAAYGWDNVRLIAHNGRFDCAILGWIYKIYPGQIADTMLMSRACQLWDGNSLDVVTNQLRDTYGWGIIRDANGNTTWGKLGQEEMLLSLNKGDEVVNADGKHLMDFTDEEYEAYAEYGRTDVDLTWSAYNWFMKEFKFPELEIDVMTATIETFTYPVVELHEPVLKVVRDTVNGKRDALLNKVGATLSDLRSDDKFAGLLRNLGVEPPTKLNAKGQTKYAFAKKDLDFLRLLEHEDPNVVELVEARLGNKSSQAVTRVERFIDLASRGALPIPLEYYAAHTGRWGGCLVADTLVLVKNEREKFIAWKPIVTVSPKELVYDGEEFVVHDGVQYRGDSKVINYNGVVGTPDHLVLCKNGGYYSLDNLRENGTAETSGIAYFPEFVGEDGYVYHGNVFGFETFHGRRESVYDIVNCGERHRFAVLTPNGIAVVHNSDAVNVQNMNRNQLVDNSTAPGTKVFYKDRADAVVEVLPDNKVHLARAGIVENDEDLLHVMGLRDAIKAPKGKKLVVLDWSQIECVSGDSVVLTDSGLKKICNISTSDLVFDGVEYVKHDGVMFKGVRDVIEYCGVVGTPDHIVYTRDGEPISLDQAAFSKAELSTGGYEWEKFRKMASDEQTNTTYDKDGQSLVPMPVWFGASSFSKRLKKRVVHRLSKMWQRKRKCLRRSTEKAAQSVACKVQRAARKGESGQIYEQNLCECRESVQELRRICPLYVGARPERGLLRMGTRPYRYERTLRKGKPSPRNTRAKCANKGLQCYGYLQRGNNVGVEVCKNLRTTLSFRQCEQNDPRWINPGRNNTAVKYSKTRAMGLRRGTNDKSGVYTQIQQRKGVAYVPKQSHKSTRFTELGNPIVGTIPVYDIINCGARHRFCCNGVIVSNCRANAWFWGEQWILDALTSGKDIYKVTATFTYGIEYDEVNKSQRFVGKSQQLGLGYGAGKNGLIVVMGKRSEEFTEQQLQSFVNSYRQSAPNIKRGWDKCKTLLNAMVQGIDVELGDNNGLFYSVGNKIMRPSGMALTYRGVHHRPGEMGNELWFWGKNKQTKKPDWEKTFGGKITENLCVDGEAEVLTDRGWVRLKDIRLTDKVHDGIKFVNHSGLIPKGRKECVIIDGVSMTKDHEVLTVDGWKQAGELGDTPLLRLGERARDVIRNICIAKTAGSNSGETGRYKEVYDILNCGPRNRFVVKGTEEPFIVHNCQAACRDIAAEKVVSLRKEFLARGWSRDDAHIVMTVHDEIIVCCKDELAEEVFDVMQDVMTHSTGWYATLPLAVDGSIAQRYGCAK